MPAIYTRTGDRGDTGLLGGSRVPKQSLRVEAYGTIDEGNAALGQAKALLPPGAWRDRVHAIQQRFFVLAAELAADPGGTAALTDLVGAADITDLEHLIDDCLEVVGPQHSFVVPGRDACSSAFHLARTVLRRAEREVLRLAEVEAVRPEVIAYLNRVSDAVYALARLTECWADQALIERLVRDAVARAIGGTAAVPVFDLAAAKVAAQAAEARADELGVPVVVAATDAGGNLICLHRMPGSLLASIDIATNKAWTATAFRRPTAELGDLAGCNGPLPGLSDTNSGRIVLFGGGVPVFITGQLAGGIGVSGGTVEQDLDIVSHALNTLTGELP